MALEKEYKQVAKRNDLNTFISKEAAVRAVLKVPAGNWKSARYAEEIAVLPAADVVPVVRCGECKHWFDNGTDLGSCDRDALLRRRDFFCADGERRYNG